MLYYELQFGSKRTMTMPELPKGLYAKDEDLRPGDMAPGIMAYSSSRIWKEVDGKVEYVKNKTEASGIDTIVDMKEFLWIKLKAKVIK